MRPTFADKVMLAPTALFECWQPTNILSWAAKGIIEFIVTMTWLLTVVWWLGPLLMMGEHIIASYQTYRRRKDRYHY